MDDLRMTAQIEAELDEMLASAPESVTDAVKEDIRRSALRGVKLVLNACSKEELGSEVALERFIASTVAHARLQMRMR